MRKKTSAFGNMLDTIRASVEISKNLTNKRELLVQQQRAHQERSTYLWNKYRDANLVQALLACRYWVGQHHELLRDALGPPDAIDQKNMATRQRQIWKYGPAGVNRYKLRITLDDGIVTTFEHKDS
jgi:hypothetical protein